MKKYYFILAMLIAFVFTGCGSDNSSEESSAVVSGYAEDDPIVGANISLFDDSGNTLNTTTTDENGFYSFDVTLEKDKVYYIKTVGVLNDKNITMNGVLNFDGNNSSININPLTQLKYKLMKEDGKSLEEAEALVREYFNISNGKSLETNRFSTTDSAYTGMKNVAELYNGTLPIDAIDKIKDDILVNDSLDDNQTKDFSFRDIVKKEIELLATSKSLALGESVTLNVNGIEELNQNYILKWTGLPDDVSGSDTIKTFTINDFAQDITIGTSLYRIDNNISNLISSSSITINFYKELSEQNLTITDSSVINNFSVSDSLGVTVPAGTIDNGETIKIIEQETNSDTTLAQFSIDTASATDGNITFNYEYDPYIVSEPRNLQITLQTETGPKILSVSEIDYINHIVKFEIPLESTIVRSASDHNYRIIIDLIKQEPTADEISSLYTRYMSYIEFIINKYGDSTDKKESIINNIKSDLGKAKFILLMKRKHSSGEYHYNILATAINYIIAKDSAELMFNSDVSWEEAKIAYYDKINGRCSTDSSAYGLPGHCATLEKKYLDKLKQADKVLSTWVGNAKLTPAQSSFIKIAKIIADQAQLAKSIKSSLDAGKTITNGDLTNLLMGITATEATTALNTVNVISQDSWTPNEMQSFYVNAMIDGVSSIVDNGLKFNFTSYAISFGVNRAFDILQYAMINANRNATIPLILALSKDYTKLELHSTVLDEETIQYTADGFTKNEFLNFAFPENSTEVWERIYRDDIINAPSVYSSSDSDESRLSSTLDPNKRFERTFLNKENSTDTAGLLNEYDRAFAYTGFRYMYGDSEAKKQFDYLSEGSLMLAQSMLYAVNEISNSEVATTEHVETTFFDEYILGRNNLKVTINDNLDVSTFQNLKDSLFNITHEVSTSSYIQNINNVQSYRTLMEIAKLKMTDAQLEALNITKIKVETYAVGLEYSSSNNAWVLNKSIIESDIFEATQDINNLFTYDSNLETNVLPFDILFSNENFTQFDNKLVGLKITLVYEKDGRDKVLSSDFVFTTLEDTEHTINSDYSGATLKSSVKDALTGNPIEGAFITVNPGGLSSLTDENGNYEVSNLAAGEYTISIDKEGFDQIEAILTLEEDEVKIYEASLSIDNEHLNTLGLATITLKDAFNNNIITNGYLKIRDDQNNQTGEIIQEINNDGNTSVQLSLPPGLYTIEAGLDGYSKSYTTISIIGDTNINKEIFISQILSEDQTRIVLSWSENPRDLDSHLVKKTDGNEIYHIYYGNRNPSNADANLDVDVTSSYGPETVTINEIDNDSVYTYYVYNYSGGEDNVLANSEAKIVVYYGSTSRTFYVPNEDGRYWKVFEILNGEIVPCTENCVQSTSDEIVRNVNNESLLFQNLPSK